MATPLLFVVAVQLTARPSRNETAGLTVTVTGTPTAGLPVAPLFTVTATFTLWANSELNRLIVEPLTETGAATTCTLC